MVQAAALQFRHDKVDEIDVGAGHVSCTDDETVAGTPGKPLFESVRNVARGADEIRRLVDRPATAVLHEVGDGRVAFAGQLHDPVADCE